MNPQNQETKRITQESIAIAAYQILVSGEDLSITAICNRAGVSRNAFYRNFETTDAVILHYLIIEWQNYADENNVSDDNKEDITMHLVRYFYQKRDLLRALRKRNLLYIMENLFLSILIPESENVAGGIRYLLYTTAFGMYGFIRAMIDNDFSDSPDDIAKMSLQNMSPLSKTSE